ncbi:MAG: HD-GYP domain-containing protein [Sporomusaceae bacterium]|jgi:putative nucleotidyltransferase with HDIG domain|nr:HD-GYP domain-containing protein [Sporomusaceae bacterium]
MYRLKKVAHKDLKPGMQVGKMVLTHDNKIIVNEGTVLNAVIIEGLSIWGIRDILIKEQLGDQDDTVIIETPRERITAKKKRETPEQKKFNQDYNETVNIIKNTFQNISYFQEIPLGQMQELAGYSIEKMASATSALNYIYGLRKQDEYTFHHSIDVSIICGIIGKWLDIKGPRLQELVLAGLLHDIGKMMIPQEIINKPARLTEEEYNIVKQHSTLGYQLVQKTPGVSKDIAFGILQHHEKMDGSGYPMGVEGKRINQFAKIIAVADTYDALTSERVYRGSLAPFVAIEIMVNEMFGKLDPATCFTFLDKIKDTLIGNVITLSDGRDAEVIHIGPNLAMRPVVIAVDGEIIDLDKRKDLRIIEAKKK